VDSMVADASAKSACAKDAANVGVLARHDVVSPQPPDLQAFHLGHDGDQDVSSFGLSQVDLRQPNVLPFQPQWPASTSVKFK
jgi:hypothetical protein